VLLTDKTIAVEFQPLVVSQFALHDAGVYMNTYDATLNARNGFPVFSTQVEANWLSKSEDKYASFRLTDEDKDEINRLSKDPNIGEHQKPSLLNSCSGQSNVGMMPVVCDMQAVAASVLLA